MQVNSLTIFIIRQTIRECQSDEAKKHPIKTGYNVSSNSQSKQITKTTKTSECLILRKRRQANLQKKKKSTRILRHSTTKYSEGNLFQADATFHYTTFNFENFQHNRNYDSYIIVHITKKIRGVCQFVPTNNAKTPDLWKSTNNLATLNSTINNRFNQKRTLT